MNKKKRLKEKLQCKILIKRKRLKGKLRRRKKRRKRKRENIWWWYYYNNILEVDNNLFE